MGNGRSPLEAVGGIMAAVVALTLLAASVGVCALVVRWAVGCVTGA